MKYHNAMQNTTVRIIIVADSIAYYFLKIMQYTVYVLYCAVCSMLVKINLSLRSKVSLILFSLLNSWSVFTCYLKAIVIYTFRS